MVSRKVDLCLCEATPPAKIERVPALVCDECGERLFQPATMRSLEGFKDRIASGARGDRSEAMRVFDFDKPTNGRAALVDSVRDAPSTG
jgi:hypothetical protein